jgi:hypothetical protein
MATIFSRFKPVKLLCMEVLQTALCTVQKWCEKTNLSINPNKTVIIPFTRRREMNGLKEPILFNETIQLSSEVKYL